METEFSIKFIISVLGGLGILGILFALFRFIVVKFFENILDTQTELISKKNEHNQKIARHCERLDNIEKDIAEIKSECKTHWHWDN